MQIQQLCQNISDEMKKVIVGQQDVIKNIILAFLANGHVILEGVPGLAKTIIARTFAKIIGLAFNRIQFTPDLMPADITGHMIYNLRDSQFNFSKGPVFTNILLADEINRCSPKTQSALLEAMQEKQVTIDGKKHILSSPFMVLATQNPIEFEGTYPLPEAQIDRFLMKLKVTYPDQETELNVLKKFYQGFDSSQLDTINFKMIDADLLKNCFAELSKIRVEESIMNYILNIIRKTRSHKKILLGASTRSAINFLQLTRFLAGMHGRDYVIPDDIKEIALPILRHRLVLQADADIEGIDSDNLIMEIIASEESPR